MQIGTRINALELISTEAKIRKLTDSTKSYEWPDVEMTWKCECGRTKSYWQEDLPQTVGRLRMELNDCGCGASRQRPEGPASTYRPLAPRGRMKTVLTISLPGETIGALEEFAQARHMKVSRAADDLLVYALANWQETR